MGRRALIVLVALLVGGALPASAEAKKKKHRRPDPVLTTLSQLERRGGDTAANAIAWRRLYSQGKSAARHLRGSARDNMAGVLDNLQYLARHRLLGARAYPAFLILQRNVEWFWQDRNGAEPFGTRTTFPGSELIYEFYPGSGWQLQPLANFGHLNGMLKLRHPKSGSLESFADELLRIGVTRHGFLAFEYYFPWSGGPPGWVSGMATATGMQALSTLWRRDGDSRYLDAARAMLPVFEQGPPWGIRRTLHDGVFFLQYSQDPSLLVGNAYAQSILGLDTYAANSGDSSAASLVSEAVSAARAILPAYDTGAWSLYYRTPRRAGAESDLGYHRLFESFLDEMCNRWQEPFCELAGNFGRYETEPVSITRLSTRGDRRHRRLRIRFTISKRSGITVRLLHGTKTVETYLSPMMRGGHLVIFSLPHSGSYRLEISAKSLNGVSSDASRQLAVKR
jgi:D-glucuronyl C5-epimerase-like protein